MRHSSLFDLSTFVSANRQRRRRRRRGAARSPRAEELPQRLQRLHNAADDEAEEVGEGPRRGGAGLDRGEGGVIVVGDDAIDADQDVFDLGDEGVEPPGDDAAAAEGFDVGDFVEDEEEDRVGEVVEVVGLSGLGVDPGRWI